MKMVDEMQSHTFLVVEDSSIGSNDIVKESDGDLMQFNGNIYLTDKEKSYRLRKLADLIEQCEIDEEMIPYIGQFNMNSHICTTQCCSGHDGDNKRKAHIDIRTDYPFETLWKKVYPVIENFENTPCEIAVYGDMGMPRYCFWLTNDKWEVTIKALIVALA